MGLSAALSIASGGLANVKASWRSCRTTWRMPARPATRPRSARSRASMPMARASACAPARPRATSTWPCRRRCSARTPLSPACRPVKARCRRSTRCRARPARTLTSPACSANLQNQFSTLLNDPSNQAQQSQVVSVRDQPGAATSTHSAMPIRRSVRRRRTISSPRSTMLNTTLGTIGGLSSHDRRGEGHRSEHRGLENQRDAAVATLSQLVDVKVLQQPNGDVLVTTSAGLPLPTHSVANQLSTSDANMQPGAIIRAASHPSCSAASTSRSSSRGGRSAPTSRCAIPHCRPTRRSWMSSRRTWRTASARMG